MNTLNKSVKVSICIPTYNNVDLVKRALGSVLNQAFLDYEVIIADDSDHDAVKAFVLAINDARVRYVKNPVQLGSPANWNAAVRLAQGEYIKILHHDDWFTSSDCLGKFVQLLVDHPQSVLGFSASQACYADQTFAFLHVLSQQQLLALNQDPSCLFFANFIGAPSATIFRRVDALPFDNALKWLVDVDFYIRILAKKEYAYAYTSVPLISIAIEGSHKVTHECSGNKAVEVFEYTHLFKKIAPTWCGGGMVQYFHFFWGLFGKYQIKTTRELQQIAKTSAIPLLIKMAYATTQLTKPMTQFYLKVKNKLRRFYKLIKTPKSDSPKVSYSQCGEDILIDFIFSWLGKQKITYLDIGTNDPIKLNNTYFFYQKGHNGVLVEPDLNLHLQLKKVRTRDLCINAGVGVGDEKELTFYLMHPDTLSTSSAEKLQEYLALGVQLKGEYKVPLIQINALIEQHFNGQAPNLLSIDVEGLDFAIIKSLDFSQYRPTVICAETLTYTNNNAEVKITEISDFLIANNYFVYADTYINTIYVDQLVWNARSKA
jgi:FkbM family methyltransferase